MSNNILFFFYTEAEDIARATTHNLTIEQMKAKYASLKQKVNKHGNKPPMS